MIERGNLKRLDDLPPLPYVAHEVLLAVNRAEINLADIATLLGKEPGLAARIVAMANSAFFAHQPPVHSVQGAVVRLGLNRVRVLAASIVLAQHFDTSLCPPFDTARYWYEAVGTAFAAARLSRRAGRVEQEDSAYLAGLLHNLGLLLLVHHFPQEMTAALARHDQEPEQSLSGLTRERLGFHYREAGQLLLREWGLPEDVVEAGAHCHAIGYRGPHAELARRVGYASRWSRNGFRRLPDDAAPLPAEQLERIAAACRGEREQLEALAQLLATG